MYLLGDAVLEPDALTTARDQTYESCTGPQTHHGMSAYQRSHDKNREFVN